MSNESVGSNFNSEVFAQTRQQTIEVVRLCASKIEAGMSEADGHAILQETLKSFNCERLWHPSKVRFAENTLKTFREISRPDITIQKGDVFFFDIGPVFKGHEGDYGETFVCGGGNHALTKNCKDIFDFTATAWKEKSLTGKDLYAVASKKAQEFGLELNLAMDGHRLGDFPHALHFKGGLPDHEGTPISGLWILEIHVRDPKTNRGAFYEDLLQ